MFENNKKRKNYENKIFYGGDLDIPPCEKNFGQYLLDQMALHSDRTAQIDPIAKITYTHGDIRTYTIRCALEMRDCGVGKGDIVTVCGFNHSNIAIPFLAATYLGAVSNPLHPNFSYNELRRMLSLTEPRMIFCDPVCRPVIIKICSELGLSSQIVSFDDEFNRFIEPHDPEDEECFVTENVDVENDNMFIVCTSGTTGLTKGVTITHAAFYINVVQYLEFINMDEKLLLYSPLAWITSVWCTGIVLYNGATKFICEYDPTKNLEIISDYKISWILLTPLKLLEMVQHPQFHDYPSILETLKVVVYGGSPATDEHAKIFRSVFKEHTFLFNGYGSSEMGGCYVYFNRHRHRELNLSKMNSNGLPCPGSYVKVIDPENGKTLGANEPGEFLIKGLTLTKSYYKDPKATAEAFDEDGWFHTGDMVKYDEDNCFYVVGRYKDILKYKGWQVSPAELEEVIRTHPAVSMTCVMGRPHATDGDLPLAFVVKKKDFDHVSEDEIINFVNERIPDNQKLRGGVIFLDNLPMTATGKIRRNDLKQLIQ